MNYDEFRSWVADLSKRLPETGRYISTLPGDTLSSLFADVFGEFELRDALAVNLRLMREGDGLSTYERDKLPALFWLRLQEQRHARTIAEAKPRDERPWVGARQTVLSDRQMGRAYRELIRRQNERRTSTGQLTTPDDVRRQWLDEIWDDPGLVGEVQSGSKGGQKC